MDLTWDDLEAKSVKRKRVDSPGHVIKPRGQSIKLQDKLREYIEKIDKEVRELSKIVGEVPNTKREIREQTWQIRSTMSLLMSRQIQELLEESNVRDAVLEVSTPTKENGNQTEMPATPREAPKATQTIGSQTEETGGRVRRWEVEVTETDIGNMKTVTDYQAHKDKKWPEKLFNKVKVTVGNPLAATTESCILVVVESKDLQMTKYIQKMYRAISRPAGYGLPLRGNGEHYPKDVPNTQQQPQSKAAVRAK